MGEAKNIGECPICLNTTKLQEHHVVPIEHGGPKDGPLILLCPACHLSAHYQAESEYLGTNKIYFPPDQLERARPVIKEIMQARMLFETRGSDEVKQLRRVIVSGVPDQLLKNLHRLKQEKGFKSLEKFLITVFEDITRRYRRD